MTTRQTTGIGTEYLGQDGQWYPLYVRKVNREGESVDAARTRRNNELLNAGRHPATRVRLLDCGEGDAQTCGDCKHHVAVHGSKVWHKCEVSRLGLSSSAASDIRLKWPACERFEESNVAGSTEGDPAPSQIVVTQ